MKPYPVPLDEAARLEELHSLDILDTPNDERFDDIIKLLVHTFHPCLAAITLLDEHRQWYKSAYGYTCSQVDRKYAICNYAIAQDDVFVVPRLDLDERFQHISFVSTSPYYYYYAGIPIVSSRGYKLGTICFIDNKDHHISPEKKLLLKVLALHTTGLLETKVKDRVIHDQVETHNRMLAITGHEMRNPLENFKFMLNMQHSLKETLDDEEAQKMNTLLRKQLDGMLDLLNNLMQWGKLQLQPSMKKNNTINLYERANQLLEGLKSEASFKNNKLFNHISPNTYIKYDPDAFDFVMRNLLTNANKFTENGSITVSADLNENLQHCISIKDTGIGMNEKELHQLTVQTGKLSNLGTRNEKGSGLGFALVREFLNRYHSTLTVQSKPRKGTTVSFCI